MKLAPVLVIVALVGMVSCDMPVPPGTKLKNLCSTDLSRAYELACYSASETAQLLGKRNMMTLPELNALSSDYEPESRSKWSWLVSRSFIPHRTRLAKRADSTGLVDECCMKACYIEELMSYCP